MEGNKEKIQIIVDTNILISALLKDNSVTAKLIRSESFDIYYPEDGLAEINRYREYVISKRKKTLQKHGFEYILKFIFEPIHVIPCELYCLQVKNAYENMKDIDEKDTPFLTLALQLNCPIWSDDNHFKKQSLVITYTTRDVLQLSL
jgi:predicted nucleic acid-binding protein